MLYRPIYKILWSSSESNKFCKNLAQSNNIDRKIMIQVIATTNDDT